MEGASGTDRIELRGLRALGTHGVLPEEQQRAQPFVVDVDLYRDLTAAGRTDALADTVDYGALATSLEAVIAGPHADLLEHLAQRLADVALAAAPQATAVTVTLHKARPPVPVDLASAGVTVHRDRDRDRDRPRHRDA